MHLTKIIRKSGWKHKQGVPKHCKRKSKPGKWSHEALYNIWFYIKASEITDCPGAEQIVDCRCRFSIVGWTKTQGPFTPNNREKEGEIT